MGLLATSSVAIDGSKFKAVNNRDKNFTRNKMERRLAQFEESVARYLAQLDTADRQEPSEELAAQVERLKEKLVKLEGEMRRLAAMEEMLGSPDQQISLTDPDSRSMATSGRGSEPIREVWIHDEAFAASRLSMMRIIARRTKAVTVAA